MKAMLGALVALVCLSAHVIAEETPAQEFPPFRARVGVAVLSDEPLKSQLRSFITRELRSLPDVIVVDERGDWGLIVNALPVKAMSGQTYGVAVSIVVLMTFDASIFDRILEPQTSQLVKSLISELVRFQDTSMQLTPNDQLETACKNIVATFDSTQLEGSRQAYQRLKHSYNNDK